MWCKFCDKECSDSPLKEVRAGRVFCSNRCFTNWEMAEYARKGEGRPPPDKPKPIPQYAHSHY